MKNATSTRCLTGITGLALFLAGALSEQPASAQEFRLQAEGAGAVWLDQPQSDHFTPGYYLALRPGVAVGRYVSLQWSYSLLQTPKGDGYADNGSAHFLTTGVRLRPLASLSPAEDHLAGLFVDANIGGVVTGDVQRLGFDAGLGYTFQTTDNMALGPVVRYAQIVQPDGNIGQNPHDAQLVTLGLNLSLGKPHKVVTIVEEGPPPECPACVQLPPEPPCADGDRDGVCDTDDRCPTELGFPALSGCPEAAPKGATPMPVAVQFEFDSATLPSKRSLEHDLDAIVKEMAADPERRVCILGYASEEGAIEHNYDLSQSRATAVQSYLGSRGIAAARLPTSAQGAACQMIPAANRVDNRRVEFYALKNGESCPTVCTE